MGVLPRGRFATQASRDVGDVEGISHVSVVDFPDDDGTEEHNDFKTLWIFYIHPHQVWFIHCDFFQVFENGDCNVWFSVLALAAIRIRVLAREGAYIILRESPLLFPFKSKFRGGFRSRRVALGSVDAGDGRLAETLLRHFKDPLRCCTPFRYALFYHYLLLRVVELDDEGGREDRLWGRWHPAVLSDLFLRQGRLCPFWYQEYLAIQDIGVITIVKGGSVSVLRAR